MENVTEKTGKVIEALKKGEMAEGIIIRITDGIAADFMTEAQVIGRQVLADDPYTEIEIGIPSKGAILKPISFKDYTRIGEGVISANTTMGRIMSTCELKIDGKVPMIAREVTVSRNGGFDTFVKWEIAV